MHFLKQPLCHLVLVFILLLSEASAGVNFNFDTGAAFKNDMNVSTAITEMDTDCIQCLTVSDMTCNNSAGATCDSTTCSSGQCNNLIGNPIFQTNNTLSENPPIFQPLTYQNYYLNLIPRPPSLSI